MNRWIFSGLVVFFTGSLTACGYAPDYRGIFDGDATPPVFLGANAAGENAVSLYFNEEVQSVGTPAISPDLGIVSTVPSPEGLMITLSSPQEAGVSYSISATAADAGGNTTTLVAEFYGYNSQVPELLINEFTVRGSGKHPDCVEIVVRESGNMAGVAFYEGVREEWDTSFVFPPMNVTAGDYLVLHCKPEGTPAEINEMEDPTVSGGYETSDTGYDFWISGSSGLSGNNGALTLYANPGGGLLDAIVYSNRTSASDERYRGFGSSALLKKVECIQREEGWIAAGDTIVPEDAVSPEGSTGTRSICRESTSPDTDSAADWHIVPTGESTFGAANSDSRHSP